jgi:HSP20 family molecular chaperone IbpA
MASSEWDLLFWQKAGELLRQAERIQRNFLQIAVGAQYRVAHGRSRAWEPPVNVVDAEESVWVIVAVPGVVADRVEVGLNGGQLTISGERPLPKCCEEGEVKIWEMPLGPFERRLMFDRSQPMSVGKVSLQDGLLIIELRKRT